jgi:hypothetical protein
LARQKAAAKDAAPERSNSPLAPLACSPKPSSSPLASCALTETEVLVIKGLTKANLNEIKTLLNEMGLALRPRDA